MKVPTRLLVLKRLTAIIETTPVERNGEPGTLLGHVYRGRNILGEESAALTMLPVISLLEAPRPDNAFFAGDRQASSEDWTLLLCGLCQDDKMNPNDKAYELHAAVQTVLSRIVTLKRNGEPEFRDDYMLGELISSFSIEPPVVRPPEDKLSSKAFFFLPIRVGLAGDLSDPYTAVP